MAKKRFRPRSGGGGGGGDGRGGYGGGYGGGGGGRRRRYGGGRQRWRWRRRRWWWNAACDHAGSTVPPCGVPYAPPGEGSVEGELPPEGMVEGEEGQLPPGTGIATAVNEPQLEPGYGVLEMHPNGYGFLRNPDNNFTRERTDPFVPGTMIEKFGLREGVLITRHGPAPSPRPGPAAQGNPRRRRHARRTTTSRSRSFDELTPINPEEWLQLETGQQPLTTRVMDLLTPLGKGQRALIVAPPRTGKTILLQHISHGDHDQLSRSHDDRAARRRAAGRSHRHAAATSRAKCSPRSLDRDVESHVRLSQLIVERCKRLAEMGKDVFMLLDSITRLARAFNKWVGNTGRTMSGGVDIKAMDIPKKLFATARAFEEGGSLTDRRHRADRHRQPHGRPDLPGVQRHRQHGAGARPQAGRPPRLAGDRHRAIRHAPRREAAAARHAARRRRCSAARCQSMHHVDAMEQLTTQLGKFKSNDEFVTLIQRQGGAGLTVRDTTKRADAAFVGVTHSLCGPAAPPRGNAAHGSSDFV